jgi:hypothetical protein
MAHLVPASVDFWEIRAGLTMTLNSVDYHENDLLSTDCPLQAWTDCDDSIFSQSLRRLP